MKKIFALLLVIVSALGVEAQSIFNNPDNEGYWGVRASLDLTVPSQSRMSTPDGKISRVWRDFEPFPGLSIGAIYNFPLVANLYLEPGLSLYYNNMLISEDAIDDYLPPIYYHDIKITDRTIRKTGMRIPVNIGYHFDFTPHVSMSVFTGPVLDLGFTMYYHVTVDDNIVPDVHSKSLYSAKSFSTGNHYNRFNLDWCAGVGVNYRRYAIAISWNQALTNSVHIAKENRAEYKGSFYENYLQISFGLNF